MGEDVGTGALVARFRALAGGQVPFDLDYGHVLGQPRARLSQGGLEARLVGHVNLGAVLLDVRAGPLCPDVQAVDEAVGFV
jgi:hypothetical protein